MPYRITSLNQSIQMFFGTFNAIKNDVIEQSVYLFSDVQQCSHTCSWLCAHTDIHKTKYNLYFVNFNSIK